jgi:hypothetical protein
LCFPGRHLPSKCHGREIWGHEVLLSYTSGIYFICGLGDLFSQACPSKEAHVNIHSSRESEL